MLYSIQPGPVIVIYVHSLFQIKPTLGLILKSGIYYYLQSNFNMILKDIKITGI